MRSVVICRSMPEVRARSLGAQLENISKCMISSPKTAPIGVVIENNANNAYFLKDEEPMLVRKNIKRQLVTVD